MCERLDTRDFEGVEFIIMTPEIESSEASIPRSVIERILTQFRDTLVNSSGGSWSLVLVRPVNQAAAQLVSRVMRAPPPHLVLAHVQQEHCRVLG